MKFEGEAPIAGFLGRQLAQSLQAELSQSFLPDVVTVVPMTKLHRLRRGYNQSERIARAAAKALGLPYQSLLCKRKHNRVQHKLSEKERFQNVQGVFAALPQAGGLRILLVDDIVTTGATLAACQTALFSAGAAEVLCAAAAMTLPSNEAGKNKH
jgi:ComF family protein